jgi:hypothetical protein
MWTHRSEKSDSLAVTVKDQPKETLQAIAWFVDLIKKYIWVRPVSPRRLKKLIRASRDDQTGPLNIRNIRLAGKVNKVGMYAQCAVPPSAKVVVEDAIGD